MSLQTNQVASGGYLSNPPSPGQTAPAASGGYVVPQLVQPQPLVNTQGLLSDVEGRTKLGSRYFYGSDALANRLVRELKYSFSRDPQYSKIVDFIKTGFAWKLNPQMGVIIGNISGPLNALAPDNYMGSVVSYVFMASVRDTGGQFLDWVKEDQPNLFKQVIEDLSAQADGHTMDFTTTQQVIDMKTGNYNDGRDLSTVNATVNDQYAYIAEIDGRRKRIRLAVSPKLGDKVEVQYYWRDLELPGLYFIEITSIIDNEKEKKVTCSLSPVLIIEEETLTDSWNGVTSVFNLVHSQVLPDSEFMYRDDFMPLLKDQHYTIDYTTGRVTILAGTIPVGSLIFSEYKYQGASSSFEYLPTQSKNNILRGVLLAFNDRGAVGQKMIVMIGDRRLDVAERYGGRWAPTVDIEVYARDPETRGELYDLIPTLLYMERKEAFDYDGVWMGAPSLGGFSEKAYDSLSGQLYHTGSISIPFETEWFIDVPMTVRISRVLCTVQKYDYLLDAQLNQEIGSLRILEAITGREEFKTNFEKLK